MIKGHEPGVVVGMPMEQYHADPALGASGVKMLIEDPAEYWWYSARNPNRPVDEPTPAMKLGTAFHTLVLEPGLFNYVMKKGVKTTKEEGMLGEGEWATIHAMQTAIFTSEKRLKMLEGGVPEVSIFFEHGGIMCKVRVDYFAPHWFVDLKTCSSVSSKRLRYDIPEFGYDVTGAMYSVAAKALKEMILNGYAMPSQFSDVFIKDFVSHQRQLFAFMMIAKEAPHACRTQLLTPGVCDVGLDKLKKAISIYEDYKDLETQWPSSYPEIEDLSLDDLSPSINYF